MRYGETEAAAIVDLLNEEISQKEFAQDMVLGLNLAYLRGAAEAFRAIGEAANGKVELILSKDPDDFDEVAANTLAGALLAYEAMQKECARQYDEVKSEGFGIILSRVGASEGAALGSADAMDEAPRVNAQVEGFSPDETVLNIAGPEAAR